MKYNNIEIDNSCSIKKPVDWYNLQKKFQGWDEIDPDQKIITIVKDLKLSVDTKFAHLNLKNKLNFAKKGSDLILLTDMELSKISFETLLKIIRAKYKESGKCLYFSLSSYYLNPKNKNKSLSESYQKSIEELFAKELFYVTKIENLSIVNDYPIKNFKDKKLLEGSNFIFVHPNIRYFLWK